MTLRSAPFFWREEHSKRLQGNNLLKGGDQMGKQGGSNKRLLDVEETAAFLGVSPRTIYNRICRRSKTPFPVKPKRIGKRVLFDIRDLEAYVDSL
jgi:predicted DNA-binding transcriptional regulator AlpA